MDLRNNRLSTGSTEKTMENEESNLLLSKTADLVSLRERQTFAVLSREEADSISSEYLFEELIDCLVTLINSY